MDRKMPQSPCGPAHHYYVSRPLYSKQTFDEENRRRPLETPSFREKLGICRCSSNRTKQVLKGLFPVTDWLLKYPAKLWLPSDIISGVSTGLVCCLQGPFPVTCLMVGSVVLTLAPDEEFTLPGNGSAVNGTHVDSETMDLDVNAREAQRIVVASTMSVLIGLFQLGMGVLQVGFLVRYLSDQLVGGFTTAAAFHVLISQLKMVLSVPTQSHSGFFSIAYTLGDVFQNIKQTNVADLVAGLLAIVTVTTVKELNTKFQYKIPVPIPVEVIVTVVATGISYAVDLKSRYGANIVHTIPTGFVPAHLPNIELFGNIVSSSFSTALVGYAVSVSVAKVYAEKYDYKIDGNQELLAFGISNIFCGAFSGFVASTALSRTAIQESTGGKTQVAGLISALMVLIVILALGPLLQPLQKSVLAGIVIANLKGMFMQISDVPILWRQSKTDCCIWVFTCIACIVLGLDVGLLTGVVFELGTVVVRTQFPACSSLGNIPATDIYKNMKDYKHIDEIPGINIFKCNSPIYFANIDYFKEKLRDAVGFDAVRVFKKRRKALKKIHKLIKSGKLKVTQNGLVPVEPLGVDNEVFEQDPEQAEGESQQDVEGGTSSNREVEVQVDWTSVLPVNVTVPKVNIHSLVMDFSAVSFLDVMAAKSLKSVIKEFMRIGVGVCIAGCDDEIVGRMEAMSFFDEVITRDMLFLSVHDAILFIKLKACSGIIPDPMLDKISQMHDGNVLPPLTADGQQIETYDSQHLAIRRLSD